MSPKPLVNADEENKTKKLKKRGYKGSKKDEERRVSKQGRRQNKDKGNT